jgi:SAM-dependent methyltransferase
VVILPRWLTKRILPFEATILRALKDFAGSLPEGAAVLDAGAGEGQHGELFRHCRYTGIDLAVGDPTWDYSQLHVVGDLSALPFADGSFDAALNVVVLEHVRSPLSALRELNRTLRPGGQLLLVTPQEWETHQIPHDYFRYTRYGLAFLLAEAGFADWEIRPVGGFFTLIGRRILTLPLFLQGGVRWVFFPFAAILCAVAGLLLPLLDRLDLNRHNTLGHICKARAGSPQHVSQQPVPETHRSLP